MIHSRYSDKVVLITGGGGMGRAAALRILDESGKVVLTDCSPTVLKIWSKNLMQWAILIESYSFSRMYGSTRIAVRLYWHGIEVFKKIDVLVTTAGILRHHPIDELTEDDWKDVIDINLTGTYHSVKSLIGHMKERRYGRIVLISSIGGRTGRPGVGVNYAAAKGGIVGMTQLLGFELGPWNITVNCVAPGPIGGGMFASLPAENREKLLQGIRLGRIGTFEDVASAIAYLGSDDASWTTGEVLDVNGGLQY